MSPEDTNNSELDTKPDFSAVPLPEPSAVKSPYAPTTGTLGEIAEADSDDGLPSPSALPSTPSATPDQAQPSEPQQQPHFKKKNLLIPVSVLIAVVLFIVGAIVIGNSIGGGTDAGGNGRTGSLFASKSFFIASDLTGEISYAFYDGKKVGDFIYDYASETVDGFTVVRNKGGKWGIIDENGKESVKIGEYRSISEYGGLYGVNGENENYLIDGTGRKILSYHTEFNDYSDTYERAGRAAYTLYPAGDNKYDIYSARGEKLASFESETVPIISSNNLAGPDSTTVVKYDNGLYVYDDECHELYHFQQKIGGKYVVVDVSSDRSIITLSTKKRRLENGGYFKEYVQLYPTYEAPSDKRDNAAIINGKFKEYSRDLCAGLVYDTTRARDNQNGYLVCVPSNAGAVGYFVIDKNGEFIKTSSGNSENAAVISGTIYPTTEKSYLSAQPYRFTDSKSFSLHINGKIKKNFTPHSNSDSGKSVNYQAVPAFSDYYITKERLTVKDEKTKEEKQLTSTTTIWDNEGEKICDFGSKLLINSDTNNALAGYYHLTARNDTVNSESYFLLGRHDLGIAKLASKKSDSDNTWAIFKVDAAKKQCTILEEKIFDDGQSHMGNKTFKKYGIPENGWYGLKDGVHIYRRNASKEKGKFKLEYIIMDRDGKVVERTKLNHDKESRSSLNPHGRYVNIATVGPEFYTLRDMTESPRSFLFYNGRNIETSLDYWNAKGVSYKINNKYTLIHLSNSDSSSVIFIDENGNKFFENRLDLGNNKG